jgi:hypothetical protein
MKRLPFGNLLLCLFSQFASSLVIRSHRLKGLDARTLRHRFFITSSLTTRNLLARSLGLGGLGLENLAFGNLRLGGLS